MEDFTALAGTLSEGVGAVRGALILSADGLVLGAYPADAEVALRTSWLRFAGMGEPTRGFLQFGSEIWCYVRRGPYAAFVVAGLGVRPGLVIDQIETALLAAEEARTRLEGPRAGPPASASPAVSGGLRAPLHRDTHPAEPTIVIHADVAPTARGAEETPSTPAPPGGEGAPSPADPPGETGVWGGEDGGGDGEGDGEEVDRFSLAREFSQLLQEDQSTADG